MNYNTKQSTTVLGRDLGGVLALAAAAALLPGSASAGLVDLTDGGATDSGSIVADIGGTAIFTLAGPETKPSGTGVFDPFLRLGPDGQGSLNNKNLEQAYNTDGRVGGQAPLDAKSDPNWTHSLQLQDLAIVNGYYVFELDAHEPDTGNKKLLSIDNIRIYTAPVADGGDATTANIDTLGTLRFALNEPNFVDPALPGGEPVNWVKFDSSHNYSTGSGQSDLYALIPVAAFNGALPTDYVYFYNLNGVHYEAENATGADGTFEEWRAFTGVPDGGSTLVLLGSALTGLSLIASRRKLARNA